MKTELLSDMPAFVSRVSRTASAFVLPLAFGACSWFTDFKNQPRVEPWEPLSVNVNDTTTPPRGQPKFSVPMQGTNGVAYGISYAALPVTIDSFAAIPNPVPADSTSIAHGRREYQINCAVCHGLAGDGNGALKKINPGYGLAPSLLAPSALGRSDGYMYGMLRNGRGIMPSYNRIEETDRWHVVNYVRALQGRTTSPADTTPIGMPGQNGTTVPGPSLTAPTRPSPYVHPKVVPTPGSPNINSATFKGGNDGVTSKEKHE